MNKPFTLIVKETEEKIVETINNSNLPAYVLKKILQDLFQQLEIAEQNEIEKYNEELKNNANKEESDK
jgi:hypothetical protein